jgi:hypothetical protein
MKRSEIPHDPRHLGVPSGAPKMISKPMVRLTQIVHLSCVKISTISEWTELSLEPRPRWVPTSVSRMISERMVHFSQTVHLSCTDINTVYKQKEERLHMTHVTLGFQRVRLKWFLSLWYVRRKWCIYLASKLALSLNKTELSLEPHHLGVPLGASKTISESMKRLAQTVHLSCTDTNTISKWKEVKFHMTHLT